MGNGRFVPNSTFVHFLPNGVNDDPVLALVSGYQHYQGREMVVLWILRAGAMHFAPEAKCMKIDVRRVRGVIGLLCQYQGHSDWKIVNERTVSGTTYLDIMGRGRSIADLPIYSINAFYVPNPQ